MTKANETLEDMDVRLVMEVAERREQEMIAKFTADLERERHSLKYAKMDAARWKELVRNEKNEWRFPWKAWAAFWITVDVAGLFAVVATLFNVPGIWVAFTIGCGLGVFLLWYFR